MLRLWFFTAFKSFAANKNTKTV